MMQSAMVEAGWSGDLDEALRRIAAVATGAGAIRVVRGGHRVALGLPRHAGAARVVLDLYQPNRLKGRVFRQAAGILVTSRLYRRLLVSHGSCADAPEVEWLREAAAEGRVGFLGCNPSHGLRCVVGGLDGDGRPFVGKLGFGRSRDAIVREAAVLERLAAGGHPGVLEALSLDLGEDWALLRLPHLGSRAPRDMGDPAVPELLRGWLGRERQSLGENGWASDLLRRAEEAGMDPSWCERMRGREVRRALVHGDFAVWNLRNSPAGLCAIDWEWAEEDGVGGVDLAYGLRQEALLVRRMGAGQAVRHVLGQAGEGSFGEYLDVCGWSGAAEDWLRFGLLHAHLNANSDCRELLAVLGMGLACG